MLWVQRALTRGYGGEYETEDGRREGIKEGGKKGRK